MAHELAEDAAVLLHYYYENPPRGGSRNPYESGLRAESVRAMARQLVAEHRQRLQEGARVSRRVDVEEGLDALGSTLTDARSLSGTARLAKMRELREGAERVIEYLQEE